MDYSALLALLSVNDANHSLAVRTYERLLDREQELWIASSTLYRTAGLIYKRYGINGLCMFNDSMDGIINIFWTDKATYKAALELTGSQFPENHWRFDESLVCVVAKHLQAYVFTFNGYFGAIGMAVVPRLVSPRFAGHR
jgi:predicted nucleic acid-binding protein